MKTVSRKGAKAQKGQTLKEIYTLRLKHALQGLFPWTEKAELFTWKFRFEPVGSKRWSKAKRCRIIVTAVVDNTAYAPHFESAAKALAFGKAAIAEAKGGAL